jgi:hypothetical protein
VTPNKLQPALLGGVFIGVLSALPVVNFANCCCLWVLGGGVLAAYLMQQNHPAAITIADGALVGMLAGVIGGVIWTFLSIPFEMMTQQAFRPFLERMIESSRDMPPEARDWLERLSGPGGLAWPLRIISMFFTIVVSLVFAMLGGILGAAIFKKNIPAPPAGTIDV